MMSYTVIFEGSPTDVVGNPMTLVTPFGAVEACGYASAFEQMEILEAALEEIAQGYGPLAETAQAALTASNALMMKAVKP
jgi:hypothetical protein